MKTVFDKAVRDELVTRINTLTPQSKAQWGKMNIHQMIRHCVIWNNWVLGRGSYRYKQGLLGKIFGKMALKGQVKDDRPMGKNMPAGDFAIKEKMGGAELEKDILMEQVTAYGHFSNPAFVHDFFGKMQVAEIGIFVYKHLDHHLRQFNA
ncbi:DinB family protein [Chitinophaga pendula]|uniref:DinB family protein n=1 Tax=Chitinophaga TaxID=79328 RepID=UPI000BAF017B|nr:MULTISPECIES: DinB family protein [Chitinophaga]ASZ13299.1 hypothetical protein CK934_21220 [Chitinophaga sp. MD30]UCJ09077.1 DinB family protein [Chitinophaga pendula]